MSTLIHCKVCGNSGNLPDFIELHKCESGIANHCKGELFASLVEPLCWMVMDQEYGSERYMCAEDSRGWVVVLNVYPEQRDEYVIQAEPLIDPEYGPGDMAYPYLYVAGPDLFVVMQGIERAIARYLYLYGKPGENNGA